MIQIFISSKKTQEIKIKILTHRVSKSDKCTPLSGGRLNLIFPYVWKYRPSYCYFKPYGNFNKDFNKL